MRDEPKRWIGASSDAPAGLRELLVAGRQQQGTPAEVQALRERLIHVLPGDAGLAWPPATRAPLATPRPTWLAWVAGGVGSAAVAWFLFRPAPDPIAVSPVADSPITSPVVNSPVASSPAPSPPAADTPLAEGSRTPDASSAESADLLLPRTAAGTPKASRPAPRASQGPDEGELLRRAQAALAEHPARALTLTAEHERRFARGALREEREVLAIEALRSLGRNAAAAERATHFERRYPRSVHLEKIRGPK